MKIIRSTPPFIAAVVAGFLSVQPMHAAPATWNNAAGGNWSVGGNWNPVGVPGTTADLTFGNTAAGASNTDDITGSTNNSLIYDWNNGAQQTTVINPGKTLTINGSGVAGTTLLLVGSATAAPASTTLAPAAITGPGGNLVLNGAGNFVVRIGNGTAGAHMATLDLSGLDSLTATVGRLLVGQADAGNAINRPSGTLILAKTNNINCTSTGTANIGVMVQDSGSNANGGTVSLLTFGQVNFLSADVMRLGGQKGNGTVNFNGAFSLPSLKIRNTDGVNRVTTIDFGFNGATPSGNSTICIADFSPGTVDVMANLVNIAQGNPGGTGFTGASTATVTLGAGIFDVNDLEIGWGNATTLNGVTTGTLFVNNNGSFGSGAVVRANTILRLARTNGSPGVVTGTLSITGGTVLANTIVSGGGSSVIAVNAGSTLAISNTAGSLAFPIRNFTLSDATLNIPALNGGGVVAVSNLTVSGSANTINISSVPPIGAYPATFTLINYQSGYTAGAGPLSLGTLPPASPAYSGTLVDAGGGVITLHLTAGPVANLGMLWTGASDNNWDTSTYNWTFLGFPTNFFNGSSPVFDDTSTQTNVVLAGALSPGSITVSNTVRQYTFTGSGNIAGAGTLTKKGLNSLIVANQGVDNIGTVVISSGTLQIGTNDLNGEISAINVTNNGALVVNRSGSLNMSAAITGTGMLTKNGNGTLILSGANSYSGATTLSGGTLEIDGTSSGAGAVTTAPGTVLAGSGTVNGAATVGGQINPGPAGGKGIFNANGGLTLSSGSTLFFDLNAANPAASDSINVVGNLKANNNAITVNFDGPPSGTYTLFTYTGSLSGSFNTNIVGSHFTMLLDTNTAGFVYLQVIGGSGSDLSWASTSDPTWDQNAVNWLDLTTSTPSTFNTGDTVLFDDTASVVTGITIPSGVNVAPTSITDNATNNSFTISGAGHITGSGGIVKSGPATLALNTANTFSGAVDVQAGILQTGNGSALGSSAAGTTVQTGATLDINGQNLSSETVTVSGAGANGMGALVNNGGAQVQALRTLILAGDTTIGGTGTLTMNNAGGAASLSTSGASYNLTKVGGNQFTLQNFSTVDAALANIDIQQGTIEFSGLTPGMGDPNFTNIVEAGATLSFSQTAIAWNKQFVFNGNGASTTVNVGTGGSPTLAGPVELHGDCVFNVGGTLLLITNTISGDGGLIKNGGSPLIISGPTLYTGDTTINGTSSIRLVAPADLASSTNIVINSGAFLTVTGMVASTFPLSSDHTLRGHGVISGALTANAGSIVSPSYSPVSGATAPVGLLTVSNAIILSGTLIMELDPDNGTNDVLMSGTSTITYGGTLNLTNLNASPLAGGSSFKLFRASSYLGSFSSITPATPGPGLTWDLSALGSSGTIKVTGSTGPTFGGIVLTGTSIVFSGSNGVAGNPYYVLVSTNVTTPRANWTSIATNNFDSNGHFSFTNSLVPPLPQRFYLLQVP